MDAKITVAVIGMGFGSEFVPLYMHHPDVSRVVICDTNAAALDQAGSRFGVTDRRTSLEDVLTDGAIDTVHLATPIPLHAEQSRIALDAGKHCACAVPMAISQSGIEAVIAAQLRSGKVYMMMETAVRTREFLWVKEQIEQGELGRIQFLKAAHYQAMESWGRHPGPALPKYWLGLPPMFYATHAIAPLLALADTRAKRVHCFGSGQMLPQLREQYGNPYPVETAIFQLEGTDVAAEVTKSIFQTARAVTESFNVYGDRVSFEWQQLESESPVIFRMDGQNNGEVRHTPSKGLRYTPVTAERLDVPDRADLLPAEIARFTQKTELDRAGHHGSHPHLVHEFVRAIVEGRKPAVDVITAANWTVAGLCAHNSAMRGGEGVNIPQFGSD